MRKLLWLPPRKFSIIWPMTSPRPELPMALETVRTPATIQTMSVVIELTASLTDRDLVYSRTRTPMAGMTFIRLPSWELKKKETTTAKKTTVMQISSFWRWRRRP